MASALAAAFEILSFGAIIVLVVLGLGIIASMMGIFNFAHTLRVADYACVLDRGRGALQGPAGEIRNAPELRRYLAP
jgi:hypothetical protein